MNIESTENKEKNYFETENIYFANTLSFMGFRYYKFTNFQGKQAYSFKNTEELQQAVTKIFELKNNLRR